MCGEMDRCGPNGKCFNIISTGYQCICDEGYRNLDGMGIIDATTSAMGRSGTGQRECLNINECLERAIYTADGTAISSYCGDNTVCTDTDGSYNCACEAGYEGDPYVKCKDINECKDRDQNLLYQMNDPSGSRRS